MEKEKENDAKGEEGEHSASDEVCGLTPPPCFISVPEKSERVLAPKARRIE